MPNVLLFTEAAHVLTTPEMKEGLTKGLVLKLWVRRIGDALRSPIVAFVGADSRVVLGTGERGDVLTFGLETAGRLQQISAPGALPMARWVEVEATLQVDGRASLTVAGIPLASGNIGSPSAVSRTGKIGGGFIGEMAGLQIWRGADAPHVWASYPLARLFGAGNGELLTEDIGPKQRHAKVGKGQASVFHDEPFAADKAAVLTFASDENATKMSPVTGLSGQLTVEAWVRPDADATACPVVSVGRGSTRLVLAAGPSGVSLLLAGSGQAMPLCSANVAVTKGRWWHVAATVEDKGPAEGVLVSVRVNGQERTSRQFGKLQDSDRSIADTVRGLVRSPVAETCRLGGTAPTLSRFRGSLAEVRLWRNVDRNRLGAMWLARARGDEGGLLACYRLDASVAGSLADIGPRRGTTRAAVGVSVTEIAAPFTSTSKVRAVRISARGKLVRERVPLRQQTSIFDATIEVAARSRTSLVGRVLEVRVDREMTALVGEAETVEYVTWTPGVSHRVDAPASGKVRLRLIADSIACPTMRVRLIGSPDELWTVVRPDEPVQRKLARLTADALRQPSDGRPSPLPAGSTLDDAEALASAARQIGRIFGVTSSGTSPRLQTRSLLGDIYDDVVETSEDAVDAGADLVDDAVDAGQDAIDSTGVVILDAVGGLGNVGNLILGTGADALNGVSRATKTASQLIRLSGQEFEDLKKYAAAAPARHGKAALTTCIDAADTLAVVVIENVTDWVEIAGSSIVNNTRKYWRVVVNGVDEALAALEAIYKRIASKIEELLAFLAYLFAWDDFLARSDEYYEILEKALDDLVAQIDALDPYKEKLAEALRSVVDAAVGQKSVGELCGIDPEQATPVFEQLDYFMEQFDRAMRSANRVIAGEQEMLATVGTTTAFTGLDGQAETCKAFLPTKHFVTPSALFATPIADLLAGNSQLADGSTSLLDAAWTTLTEGAKTALEAAIKLLKGRIDVPWLTDMVETSILGGRQFTVLRVVAMAGAIPAVLTEKIEAEATTSSTKSPRSTTTTESSGTTQKNSDPILWVTAGMSLTITAVLIGQTAREYGERESPAKQAGASFLDWLIGVLTGARGILMVRRTATLSGISSQMMALGLTSAGLDVASGAWVVLAAKYQLSTTVDLVVRSIFGLAAAAASISALCLGELSTTRDKVSFGLRAGSWIGNSLVRISSRADDSDTSGKVKIFTGGLAAVVCGVDITEAIYGNIGEVEEQTG